MALRVLVEKIGPRGYGPMPTALEHMTKQERVLHCNHLWEAELHKVGFIKIMAGRRPGARHAAATDCLARPRPSWLLAALQAEARREGQVS